MLRKISQNPEWTDSLFNDYWSQLESVVGPALMPVSIHPNELGCGKFGCVFTTNTPGIVVKITSDESEAGFVENYKNLSRRITLDGIVKYFQVFTFKDEKIFINGKTQEESGEYPLFILWREEAHCLGLDNAIDCYTGNTEDRKSMQQDALVAMHLEAMLDASRKIGIQLYKQYDFFVKHYGEDKAVDVYLSELKKFWEELKRNPDDNGNYRRYCNYLHRLEEDERMREVSLTCQALAYEGILLADIHEGNLGLVERAKHFVITDPGLAVVMNPKYFKPSIAEIKA